ncbi:serine O-acetyltransferase [Granulicella tundricola]|uniref:Serine acetyltransferase n=1 Tax=Granulicella tundricola (strain ATCC BAA-1859 / DSM 23138 / MP5ACTX9) TaxID=1198114 RepID=E8X017_GRATM|nr:serine acetyltransferase [Granulicella tundricola]ADW68913.1 serine acetyltransferase CysE, putative [Granulicella tundricola MP5ACTX9]
MFANIREDWRTHDSNWGRHGFWALVVYRFGRWRYSVGWRPLRAPLSFFYKLLKFFSDALFGIEMPCETVIGKRFVIEHVGGIVISGDAIFGDDCIVRNGVTVGLRHRGLRGSPQLGDRVDIGAGAKLLGPIRIGNDVSIGANAVVLCDVPDGCIAVGIPARIIPRKSAVDAALPLAAFEP